MSYKILEKSYKTVFTNGCFDILHRGHIELLKYCKSLGGHVVVGINSDFSVKQLKGESRPFFTQQDRKFNQETPYEIIKEIKPDVIVKGGDYDKTKVVGHDLAEIKIFNYIDGYSTSKIIGDIT